MLNSWHYIGVHCIGTFEWITSIEKVVRKFIDGGLLAGLSYFTIQFIWLYFIPQEAGQLVWILSQPWTNFKWFHILIIRKCCAVLFNSKSTYINCQNYTMKQVSRKCINIIHCKYFHVHLVNWFNWIQLVQLSNPNEKLM